MKLFNLVVTRHPALIEYLQGMRLLSDDCNIISHATAEDVRGKDVVGVLPHHLSCLTKTFSEVPLDIPASLRGCELHVDQIEMFAKPIVTYVININNE